MAQQSRKGDWWSESGPDCCEFCSAAYYFELGYHCIDCDRPVCPSCVLTVLDLRCVLCPECNAERETANND